MLSWVSPFNPRPDTVFRHLRSDRGVGATSLGVSKRSVVELSGKDQHIALAEYSRLVVLFLVLDQYLTQLWQVKGQIFGNSIIFQLSSPYQQNYLSFNACLGTSRPGRREPGGGSKLPPLTWKVWKLHPPNFGLSMPFIYILVCFCT